MVRKVYREPYTGEAHANTGVAVGLSSGTIPARWVVVVRDASGKEHFVNVEPKVWEQCEVGDVISADDPLVDLP